VETAHKHYTLCYNAHRNTSFSPDRRAEQDCKLFDENAQTVSNYGGNLEVHEKLFITWKAAQSRCASSMITGPANFPVARMEKANASERNHGENYFKYIQGLKERYDREAFYAANPHARPISSDDTDAIPRIKEKLEAQEKAHAAMLAANKAKRGTHQPFELSNSNARIKNTRERLERMVAATKRQYQEIKKDGYTVIQNVEANRVQIRFNDIPGFSARERLKSLGFRWAPSLGMWQRQLTNAAIYAAKQFMASHPGEKAEAAA
jgi:hypothetical protein